MSQTSHASVLGLNALLVESPSSLIENFGAETQAAICQGLSHQDVSLTPFKREMQGQC